MTEPDRPPKREPEPDDPYSIRCPGCPGRIAMGSALRAGKIICTSCSEVVSLKELATKSREK
jgi:hypothetical protein